jgi:hypothetical protein
LWYWGLNSGPTPQATPPALFCEGFFQDRVSQTIYLGSLQTSILLISASIIGVSHWHLALKYLLKNIVIVSTHLKKDILVKIQHCF